jgi:hypothetical protein
MKYGIKIEFYEFLWTYSLWFEKLKEQIYVKGGSRMHTILLWTGLLRNTMECEEEAISFNHFLGYHLLVLVYAHDSSIICTNVFSLLTNYNKTISCLPSFLFYFLFFFQFLMKLEKRKGHFHWLTNWEVKIVG